MPHVMHKERHGLAFHNLLGSRVFCLVGFDLKWKPGTVCQFSSAFNDDSLPSYIIFFFFTWASKKNLAGEEGETVSWGTQYLNTVTGFSLAVSSLTATSLLLPPANPSLPTPSCKWVLRVSVASDWLQAVCRHLSFRMDIDVLSREESFQRCSVCHGCLAF